MDQKVKWRFEEGEKKKKKKKSLTKVFAHENPLEDFGKVANQPVSAPWGSLLNMFPYSCLWPLTIF